ncbi:uncharacterized protein LOC130985533 [Salvia miltiorrhiza]|uniref:uncharacterized protein LOC130985533 n=1 Tax=Salvia miltiorrhiza TaxID=226208 RepID=UPI0025ABD328|nr:uncharacterized protein LOC130985533 [Salvia miltiorrhiza]
MGAEDGWNSWAELILAAAVLRHGQHRWDVVASELRTRSRDPTLFTPELQVCKSKYNELQKRYSGSRVWFEELRKQCVAELKQQLARSEASIGFLESKIKYLESEKQNPYQADCDWSQTGSPNFDGTDPSSQNTSKDEHSAGSYTEDPRTRTDLPCKRHHQEMEIGTSPSLSVSYEGDKDLGIQKLAEAGQELIAGKRRGRKRKKDCKQAVTEVSVGERDNLGSSNAGSTSQKEATATPYNQNRHSAVKSHSVNDAYTIKTNNLMEIFRCIAHSEAAHVFKHRMDSQKQERYRKIIRHHVDIGMIRSRIISHSIKSAKELFRDLLLLASNALVFYSRNTLEYRSALSLRNLVMKEYKQHCRESCHEGVQAAIPAFLLFNPPVRPRSARPRPCKDRLPGKWYNVKNILPANDSSASEELCNSNYDVSMNAMFKAKKVKLESADTQPKSGAVKRGRVSKRSCL